MLITLEFFQSNRR